MSIVKEHKLGCSVATPHCDKCGKFCNSMGHKLYFYQTGGVHFNELFFYCTKCQNKLLVPEEQLEILNRYSEPSRESYYRIEWQASPNIRVGKKGETFYPV